MHRLEPAVLQPGRPSPAVIGMDHVAGVGHVASAATLVGVQFTGTQHVAVAHCHKGQAGRLLEPLAPGEFLL